MKTQDILLVALLVAIGYIIYQQQKQAAIALTGIGQLALPEAEPLVYKKTLQPLAQTLVIGDSPQQLPKYRTDGSFKIVCPIGNAGSVYLGRTSTDVQAGLHRFELEPGASEELSSDELGLYYYGTTNDSFSIFCQVYAY